MVPHMLSLSLRWTHGRKLDGMSVTADALESRRKPGDALHDKKELKLLNPWCIVIKLDQS